MFVVISYVISYDNLLSWITVESSEFAFVIIKLFPEFESER